MQKFPELGGMAMALAVLKSSSHMAELDRQILDLGGFTLYVC